MPKTDPRLWEVWERELDQVVARAPRTATVICFDRSILQRVRLLLELGKVSLASLFIEPTPDRLSAFQCARLSVSAGSDLMILVGATDAALAGFFNGLMERKDADEMRRTPLGFIGGTSGVAAALGCTDPVPAALRVVRGVVRPCDALRACDSSSRVFALASIALGSASLAGPVTAASALAGAALASLSGLARRGPAAEVGGSLFYRRTAQGCIECESDCVLCEARTHASLRKPERKESEKQEQLRTLRPAAPGSAARAWEFPAALESRAGSSGADRQPPRDVHHLDVLTRSEAGPLMGERSDVPLILLLKLHPLAPWRHRCDGLMDLCILPSGGFLGTTYAAATLRT